MSGLTLTFRTARRVGRSGLTLVELMVAVAVLAIMVLVVGSILVSARDAVKNSQQVMQTNTDARAIIDRLRADLSVVSKDGFLMIVAPTAGTPPILAFTSLGPYNSVYDPTVRANAALVCYSIYANGSEPGPNGAPKNILSREAMLLTPGGNAAKNAYIQDVLNVWLGDFINWPRQVNASGAGFVWNGYLAARLGGFALPPLYTNPKDLDEVTRLWPFLARPLSMIQIERGQIDPAGLTNPLIWRGYKATLNPTNNTWNTVLTRATGDLPLLNFNQNDDTQTEFLYNNSTYTALWTARHKELWPRLLRVTFSLGDPAQTYEAVIDLP